MVSCLCAELCTHSVQDLNWRICLFPQLLDTPCFCADPCMHNMQDLNRLLCFCHFWNHGIWRFQCRVSPIFSVLWGLCMVF